MSTSTLITADELLQLAGGPARYELVQGVLRTMSPASHQHGRIAGRIHVLLGAYVEAQQLGEVYAAETGFLLEQEPDTVRAPDVAFVRAERVAAAREVRGYFPGAPDLVVEVISPNDLYTEVDEKIIDWITHGTQMVIVINPRHQTVRVYRSVDDEQLLTTSDVLEGADVVPGWSVAVARIFA